MKPKHLPGPPMTLGNMREQGVQNLIAFCLNDACRHRTLIDVSS
jgi:transposase